VDPIEFSPDGLRFHAGGGHRSARVKEGIYVFLPPRLLHWAQTQAKRLELKLPLPEAVRFWEQWSVVSRDPLKPGILGHLEDMTVWTEWEGAPSDHPRFGEHRIGVLRAVYRQTWSEYQERSRLGVEATGAGAAPNLESFDALGDLFRTLLRWDRYSIRSMRPRVTLEWSEKVSMPKRIDFPGRAPISWVAACDGPLVSVVSQVRNVCGGAPGGSEQSSSGTSERSSSGTSERSSPGAVGKAREATP
jgi:hypothetical protein